MSFFNDAQRDGLLTGRYICSECGGLMEAALSTELKKEV